MSEDRNSMNSTETYQVGDLVRFNAKDNRYTHNSFAGRLAVVTSVSIQHSTNGWRRVTVQALVTPTESAYHNICVPNEFVSRVEVVG